MEKIDNEEYIINEKINSFLGELQKEESGFVAVQKIEKFASIFSGDYSNESKVFNKLLKWYIEKAISKGNNNYSLEKIFQHEMAVSWMNVENLNYLLSQNIDLQYEFTNVYTGCHTTVAETLAFETKEKEKMKLVLEKIGNKLYYVNGLDQNIDLCRMNIIAGNLEKAFEIFKSDEYEILLGNSNAVTRKAIMDSSEGIHIDEFNPGFDDMIFSIINTLTHARVSNEEKEDFLKKIIYSDKLKFFNIENLEIISTFVSVETYNSISDYLYYSSEQEKITLFRAENTESSIYNDSIMFYVSSKEFKEKIKGRTLKKQLIKAED